jgi:hypothetical protein
MAGFEISMINAYNEFQSLIQKSQGLRRDSLGVQTVEHPREHLRFYSHRSPPGYFARFLCREDINLTKNRFDIALLCRHWLAVVHTHALGFGNP